MDGSVISTLLLLAMGATIGSTVTLLVIAFWAADEWAREGQAQRDAVADTIALIKANPAEALRPDGILIMSGAPRGRAQFDQNNPHRNTQ